MVVFTLLMAGAMVHADAADEAIACHRSMVESIRTMSGKMIIDDLDRGDVVEHVTFAVDRGSWRVIGWSRFAQLGTIRYDQLLIDGVLTTVATMEESGRPPRQMATRSKADRPTFGNPWREMLVDFALPDGQSGSLQQFQQAHDLVFRKHAEGVESRRAVTLATRLKGQDMLLTFDRDRNYLIQARRGEGQLTEGLKQPIVVRSESRVVATLEPVPGIFLPAEVISESWRDGVRTVRRARFQGLVVNAVIDRKRFNLRFPAKTMLSDTIAGRIYRVDESGREIVSTNPQEQSQRMTLNPPSRVLPEWSPGTLQQSSTSAETGIGLTEIFLALAVFFMGGAAWLWFRERVAPGRLSP